MNAIVQHDQTRLPTLQSGGAIRAIVPQTMEDAYRLGKAIVMSGTNPKGMDTPEKCMIAIMRGLEVGLSPMQAIDKIAIVNGRPVIWGDGALGLVRGSGLCEFVRETNAGSGDARAAKCEVKRKGEPEPITRIFSVADAKKAGLWDKQGPWKQFPDRMLQMRARAFALRDGFADVLGGLYLREEMDDQTPMRDVTPPSQPSMRPPSLAKPVEEAEPVNEAEAVEEIVDQDDVPVNNESFLEELDAAMATAKNPDQVIEIWDGYDVEATLCEDEDALQRAFNCRANHIASFSTLNAG
jgi:hypothetical protein